MNTDIKKAELDHRVLPEVKKAIDLFTDQTYTVSEFYSHVLQIIRDEVAPADLHRTQLERLMFKVEEMRELQRLYYAGHRSVLGKCKDKESDMDKKIMGLKSLGYSTEQFKKSVTQENLFGG